MDLKLKLSKWQWFAGCDVRFQQGGNGLEFPAFNVNFQNVDMLVSCV